MSEIGFWPTLLLTALATWRLTHLLAAEDGPADLVLRLRTALGDSGAGHLLDCFQCLSLWVAAPLALVLGTEPLTWLIAWLGLSGAACLLERCGWQAEAVPAPPLVIGGELDHGMLWPRPGSTEESQAANPPVPRASAAAPAVPQRAGGTRQAASGIAATGGSVAAAPGQVVLRYLERSPVVILGSATGRRYEFSAAAPKQRVDARDAAPLLATPFFRRADA